MKNTPYRWIPGNGISLEAVERMRRHFPRPPAKPMGEAWFIGDERRMYTELFDLSPAQIEIGLVREILTEIVSGINCFGHLPEWEEWFKYLLPELIARSNEPYYFSDQLAQPVITAFMNVYWREINEEYSGFRQDIINSLSRCLMEKSLWIETLDEATGKSYPKATFLDTFPDGRGNPRLNWNSGHGDETFSAWMFFCLKYLQPVEIKSWTQSLFKIEDPYWKGAFAIWLVAALQILKQPIITPGMIEKANPQLI